MDPSDPSVSPTTTGSSDVSLPMAPIVSSGGGGQVQPPELPPMQQRGEDRDGLMPGQMPSDADKKEQVATPSGDNSGKSKTSATGDAGIMGGPAVLGMPSVGSSGVSGSKWRNSSGNGHSKGTCNSDRNTMISLEYGSWNTTCEHATKFCAKIFEVNSAD